MDQKGKRTMIYLDNAATTKPRKEVVEAMMPYLEEKYANPSSIYEPAMENQRIISGCRKIIADTIGADSSEIYFTAGGSEADNWAIKGVAHANRQKGKHIITTKIEHHAVLNSCKYLEEEGYEITYLDVDRTGRIFLEQLEQEIRDDTILVSVMAANNEIGTIQPIREIAKITRERNVLFHTDAVQMYGNMPVDVKTLGVDFLSASAHKFKGPRGCGFLYVRNGAKIAPLIHGGSQEKNMRAGTENTAAIVGMAKAAEISMKNIYYQMKRESYHRNYLVHGILREIKGVKLTGHSTYRLPGHASFCFENIEGESLLILLDMEDICASAGAACTTGTAKTSHVLRAIGLGDTEAKGSIRLTLNEEITIKEIESVIAVMKKCVKSLRES